MGPGDWVTLGVGIVAALVAVPAAWVAVRAERRASASAHSAADEARRALEAAEKSAAEQAKAADALQRQTALAEAQAAKYEPPWELRYSTGDMYEAFNNSGDPEYAVRVEGPAVVRGPAGRDVVHARAGVRFMGDTSWNGEEDWVFVTWNHQQDLSDQRREWKGLLPPQTPRH